jgi:hypothetical protein
MRCGPDLGREEGRGWGSIVWTVVAQGVVGVEGSIQPTLPQEEAGQYHEGERDERR